MPTSNTKLGRLFPAPFTPVPATFAVSALGAVLFASLAYISIDMTRHGGRIAAIWLPNAFAVAFLLRSRMRGEGIFLAAIFLGNLTANLLHGDSLAKAPMLAASNTIEILLAVGLARHFIGQKPDMRNISDLKRYLLTSVAIAPLASASLATASLSLEQDTSFTSFAMWAMSDGLALAIVTPCTLIFVDSFRTRRMPTHREAAEWALVAFLGIAVTTAVFTQTSLPLLFLVPPIVVISAFRLGSLGTACSTLIVAVIATVLTGRGMGPINLLDYTVHTELLVLEVFLASAFLMGLPVAAVLNAKKLTLADLAKQKAKLAILADNITDAILRYDLEGVCTFGSPSVTKVLGRPPSSFVGRAADDLVHPDAEEAISSVARRLLTGETDMERLTYRRLLDDEKGRPVWIEADCAIARERGTGKRDGIIVSARDVSDRVRLEAQLQRARNHAEQAARAKAQFLANMSHEIRTPMNGVLGFAELLQQADLPAEQARQIDIIAHSGRSMMAILNDILDISKIEAGELVLDEKPLDLARLVDECTSLHRAEIERKNLALDLYIDPQMPAAIVSDPLRLRQILLNLLGNAVKFTASGSICVGLKRSGQNFELAVSDTGIGIDADRVATIFNPFEQAEGDTTRRFGGTGLGLSISRQLAELLGGSLTATSTRGDGSRFTLSLPLRESENAVAERRSHRVVEALKFPGNARVLLADDHDVNRMLVSAMLARCNLSVDIAKDGKEAVGKVLEAAQGSRPYDLVLMDIQMPECDGYEATRAIRRAGIAADALPIIALTANAFADDVKAAKIAGMQGHLAKPLVFSEFVGVLNRWLPHRIVGEDAGAEIENAIAAKPSAQKMWAERRAEAVGAARSTLQSPDLSTSQSEELARLMHKLAGTAGMFGEPRLGKVASTLERALRSGLPNADRAVLVQRLLEIADPQRETAAP